MKTSLSANTWKIVLLGTCLSLSNPAVAQSDDMLSQAADLVHQAWNPGGDPPGDEQRTDLLTKAMQLAQNVPDHRLHGHRVKAIRDIKAALLEIKQGDPDHKVNDLIRDADSELRTALSDAT